MKSLIERELELELKRRHDMRAYHHDDNPVPSSQIEPPLRRKLGKKKQSETLVFCSFGGGKPTSLSGARLHSLKTSLNRTVSRFPGHGTRCRFPIASGFYFPFLIADALFSYIHSFSQPSSLLPLLLPFLRPLVLYQFQLSNLPSSRRSPEGLGEGKVIRRVERGSVSICFPMGVWEYEKEITTCDFGIFSFRPFGGPFRMEKESPTNCLVGIEMRRRNTYVIMGRLDRIVSI